MDSGITAWRRSGARAETRFWSTCKAAGCRCCTSLVEPSPLPGHLRAVHARRSARESPNGGARPLGSISDPKQRRTATSPEVLPIKVAAMMQPAEAPRTPMNTTQGLLPTTDANPLDQSPYYVEHVTAVLVVRDTRNAPSLHTRPSPPPQTASAASLSAALGLSAAPAHRLRMVASLRPIVDPTSSPRHL